MQTNTETQASILSNPSDDIKRQTDKLSYPLAKNKHSNQGTLSNPSANTMTPSKSQHKLKRKDTISGANPSAKRAGERQR